MNTDVIRVLRYSHGTAITAFHNLAALQLKVLSMYIFCTYVYMLNLCHNLLSYKNANL